MNYSDENQKGLMSLLAASQQGLDPTTAYSMLQDIQGDQQEQIAQRQERQSGLIGLLMESAQGGMPYGGAEAMMEAAPGPFGPALQNALSALYPTGDQGGPDLNHLGHVMDSPAGGNAAPGSPVAMQGLGAQAVSSAFQPPQPSPTEQIAVAEFEQQQALQSDLALVQQDAASARANQWTVDDFIAKSQSENPELWSLAPEEMMSIVQNTFGETAVQMRGMELG